MRLPILIAIAGIICLAILLSTYFFIYNPSHKKIQKLKEYVKSSEKELSTIKLKMKDYKPTAENEKLLWAQAEEQLLTVISNKEHLHLLAKEVSDIGSFLDFVDISYLPSKPSAANPTSATGETNPAAAAASEPSQASNLQIDHTLLKMKFYCKYGELLDFLKNLNQLQRLIAIESLSIKKAIPKILVEMTFRAYYWQT